MNPHARTRTVWRRLAAALLLLATAGAVFALYQRPDFLVMVADQLWACF